MHLVFKQHAARCCNLSAVRPRFPSATPCRLCFTTRKQIYKMKDLELALLRAFSKQSEQWLAAMVAG